MKIRSDLFKEEKSQGFRLRVRVVIRKINSKILFSFKSKLCDFFSSPPPKDLILSSPPQKFPHPSAAYIKCISIFKVLK